LNKDYSKYISEYFLEAGVKYRFSNNFLLFAEGNLTISDSDLLDDYNNSDLADFYGSINLGISYALTFEQDSDNDGVTDEWDKCDFTPSNVEVDEFGCPADKDLDGIPDYMDHCRETPVGIEVDRYGCALDEDSDGVPDYNDDCPGTPLRVIVDQSGCPLDADEDGVPDYLDLCPDTQKGSEVDSSGCYVLDESKNFLESVIIYYDSGNDTIAEFEYDKLDKLVFYMKTYDNISWYIEGHKDNVEKSESEEISLSRAKLVFEYFIRKGVPVSKLKIVDRGSSFAVDNNDSISGRSKNRRVVIFGIK
jgi:outer membrane protein OmpA-like peptidoglycan-associated protein